MKTRNDEAGQRGCPTRLEITRGRAGSGQRRRVGRLALGIMLGGFAAGPANAAIVWADGIQTDASPWGFDMLFVQHPIDREVPHRDASGVNLSRVANPIGEGFALRQYATFDAVGSRSQALISSYFNPVFAGPAKSAEGVWVAQEWYFPAALRGGTWLNLWDWQSTDLGGGNRWHTCPGLMLSQDGSMKVQFAWGGAARALNPTTPYSSTPLPVGQWFDIEMHYVWSAAKTATVTLWINGQLALEQRGVQTRAASHTVVESQLKFYGAGSPTPWLPCPSLKYVRNVRIGNARIWRDAAARPSGLAPEIRKVEPEVGASGSRVQQ